MKKILISLLFLFIAAICFGQFPVQQGLGAPKTQVNARGGLGADSTLVFTTSFADTSTANLGFIDGIPGATIRTVNTLWIRSNDATRWIEFGSGALNIDTTESILLVGDGSTSDPLTASLQVSTQSGNILQVFPDGIYASPQADCQNGLMSGGRIVLEQNLDYTVTPAVYTIGCAPFNSIETLITLDASDPTFDRIDLVVVDTNSNVVVITGTPSDDPQNPSYDPESQLPLSFILVTANATEPVFCRDSIYYISNGQTWTGVVSNASRINTTSTNNPFSVTQDVEFTLAQNNDQYRVTKSSTIAFATYSVLTFKIRSKATWPANSRVNIRVYSTLTPLGINVALGDGIFGFNSSITNAYQTIVIPLGNFGGGISTGNNILFTISTTSGNTIGFYLDNIQLLGCEGTPIPVTGRFWSQGGDRWGTLGVIGTLDNFGMQHVVNNTNHTLLQAGGSIQMQGATPRLSFFLGTGAASDYFIERNGTTVRLNSAGDYAIRVSANTMYSIGSANGHLWNSSAAAFQMQLNSSGNLLLGTNANNATTIFNVTSTTKSSHPAPSMTNTQMNAIATPQTGDFVYNSTNTAPYYYNGVAWVPFGNVTASNGLSTTGINNVVLGGSALSGNSSILTSGFTFDWTGSSANHVLKLINSSTGFGLSAVSTSGDGIFGQGGNIGVVAYSPSGSGLQASSDSGLPLEVFRNTSTTNAVVRTSYFLAQTTGTAADGLGGSIDFRISTTSGLDQLSNQLVSKWTTAANATRTSQFIITGVNSAVTADLLTISGNGQITANKYGIGSFTAGTPAYTLQVTSAGLVIEGALGAGTGNVLSTGTPVNDQLAVWTNSTTIEGDAALTFTGGALTLGLAGTTLGQLKLSGNTAQTVTLRTLATAGNYTLTFPSTDGNAGEILSTDGSGGLSWIAAGAAGTVTNVTWTGGIVSIANPTTVPAFTIAGTSGGIPYFSGAATWASSAALAANAIVIGGGAGVAPSTTTTAAGILTFLGTPSSANLRTVVTDETGTGNLYFQSGDLGTPTAGTVSTGVTLGDVTVDVTGTDATGDIYYRSAGGLLTRLAIGTAGQMLVVSGGLPAWTAPSAGGTVTSITLTQPAAGITITNSGIAITTSGTRTFALANDLAGVEGLATTGIVRRTATDTWSAGTLVSLTTEITGTLSDNNGGTGFDGSSANGQLLIGNSSNSWTRATLTGTTNQINVTNASGSITLSMAFNPTEQTLASGSTINWNWSNGANAVLTLNSNGATLANPTNVIPGYSSTLRLIQGSGGSHTITTWTNVRWANGVTPTLTTTAGATDMITFYAISTTSFIGYFTPNVQ